MNIYGEYFYGNKISDYGLENGYVDYGTLAKAFDAVLNNDVVERTMAAGFDWEIVSGWRDNSEQIEEINADIEELEQDAKNYRDRAADAFDVGNFEECEEMEKSAERCADRLEELRERLEELEREQDETPEIFQWYIVSNGGAKILQEVNELVYYCSELDMYVWGVDHFGTSWAYVLTNIPCNTGKF